MDRNHYRLAALFTQAKAAFPEQNLKDIKAAFTDNTGTVSASGVVVIGHAELLKTLLFALEFAAYPSNKHDSPLCVSGAAYVICTSLIGFSKRLNYGGFGDGIVEQAQLLADILLEIREELL